MSDAPAKNAPKADWVEFAVANGAERTDVESMTKADLVAEYGAIAEQQSQDDTSNGGTDTPSEDQPGPEPEELAKLGAQDEGTGDSLADELGDQPRHEFETAALARAEEAATGEVQEPPPAEDLPADDRLLPGEAIGAEGPPPQPYQFSPRDGQFEGQQERNDEYAEKVAEYHEENVQKAEGTEDTGEEPEPPPDEEEPEQPDEPNQEGQN